MSSRMQLDLTWLAGAAALIEPAYWTARGTRAASLPLAIPEANDRAEVPRKVGRRFEDVHRYALERTPGVRVLAANETLRAERRTLGEVDVLYRHEGVVVHREVAIKYYLAARPGREASAWVGPGRRDRLDLKLERLATHQTTLARRAKAMNAWPDHLPFPERTEVLLLGALFSPPEDIRLPEHANADIEHGRWYEATDFRARFGAERWAILEKPWWLSPQHARHAPVVRAAALAESLRGPRFVCRIRSPDERAFVVPDGWWKDLPSAQ
ncbi:MAG: DUF1853 family protein [Myxococcota bacterium]